MPLTPQPERDPRLERLATLMEECAEVILQGGKILRHGWDLATDGNTGLTYDNRELLTEEIGHVKAAIDILEAIGDVNWETVADYRRAKLTKLIKYLHAPENVALVQSILEAEAREA